MALPDRKSEHLRIAAGAGVEHRAGPGLADVRLRHRALPERDLDDVGLETQVLGRTLRAPLMVSAMTGGTPEAATINRRLMAAARRHGLALTFGSGRQLLDDPELLRTYRPDRDERPPLLLANLGASQLRGGDGPDRAERIVELLGADGLSVHLNPLQEAIQPEGDAAFEGVLAGVAAAVARLAPAPVVVKEVGFGLSGADVEALGEAGVAAVDVAGAGGTNWALVEGFRDDRAAGLAAAFSDWGLTTAEAIEAAVAVAPGLPVIASGGLRDGVDCAKCLALGAVLAGMARPLLLAARADRVDDVLATVVRQLQIAAWLTGAARTSELGREHLA